MIRKHLTFPFHTKEVKDTGEFTGYAAVFDNVDYYRDVIRPGAFTATIADWKARGMLPPILWQHNPQCPIGPHLDMYEDEKGLYVHGKLLVNEIQLAREAHALLKNKVISGLSIGFDVAEEGMQYDGKTNIWNLTKVDLWEDSLVTFPANDQAQVEEVKSALTAGKLPPPSVFEGLLRDAGFSRKQAAYITSHGYTGLRDSGLPLREAEVETVKSVDLTELNDYLQRYGT
jgi:Escherichia/Staphylococcus phage prohead protease